MAVGFLFLSSWVIIAILGFYKKQSAVLSVGGGFIAACVTVIVYATVINPKSDFDTSRLPAGAVYAEDLYSAYEENEVAADQAYKGKTIAVYGKVKSIDTLMGYAFVTLKGKMLGGTKGVQCAFNDEEKGSLAALSKGQHVIVEGKCGGKSWAAGVQLTNCKIR